jgi:hypothetical protein
MDAGRMTGERKAALALASLGEADRAWLLGQLPETPRARVNALLGELREMRVSFDRELLKQLGPAQVVPKDSHALDGADTRALLQVLQHEPDWLVTLVLRAREWPWRSAFLQQIGAERTRRVARIAPDTAAPRPKLIAALLDALEAKVRAVPAVTPERARPFWRRRLAWRR